MRLFLRRKDPVLLEKKELTEKIKICNENKEFFILAIRYLLVFIKKFSLVFNEVDTQEFKKDIDNLIEKFVSEEKIGPLKSLLEKRKKTISSFIKRQKDYLNERENEFKDIIDLLTDALITLNTRNNDFNLNIQKRNEKVKNITLLDDIKKIKIAIKQEVACVRKIIQEKQSHDNTHMEKLSEQVNSLKVELQKAASQSLIDGLTGIYNRKAFDMHLQDLIDRSTLAKAPFSMLFLDIDNFKNINDTYGHQIGDRIILALVQKCRQFIRKEDLLCRYGGEEFVIILPGASLKVAFSRAQKICNYTAKTRYTFNDGKKDHALTFTVSIGVSSYCKGDTVTTLIERSDRALYEAKRSGKNRVVSKS